jgi:ABC-type glycerol-3-phosphate transport system permease component
VTAKLTTSRQARHSPRAILRRVPRLAADGAIVLSVLVPLYLLFKQAVTPDLASFAWPPQWLPQGITAAHFVAVAAVGELRSAVLRSIFVGAVSASIATVLGTMLAYAMAREVSTRAAGFAAVSAVRLLPMIAVAIPLAISLIALGLYDLPSGLGLAIVHAAIAVPTTALTAYAGLLAVPREIEEAAWLDGASPLRIFVTIDLPQARASIAAGFILAFIMSWDEFGFALLLQVTNRTLPPLLYYYTVFGEVGPASALAILMMIPALCVVVALRPMLRSGLIAGSFR